MAKDSDVKTLADFLGVEVRFSSNQFGEIFTFVKDGKQIRIASGGPCMDTCLCVSGVEDD